MNKFGYQINLLSRLMRQQLANQLIEYDLTPTQYAVLKELETKGKQTASMLGKSLYLDKPTISGVIKRLVEKDIIEKESHPTDSRATLLILTEKGFKLVGQLEAINDLVISKTLKGLAPDCISNLEHTLEYVIGNLKED